MPEGLDAASFEFYEGIRILVPGAAALGVVEGGVRTFTTDGSGMGLNALIAFFVALLAGLVFYFVDAPAKAAIFSPLQPTDTLFSWGVRPKQDTTTINLYFVMLDTSMPSPIRARALYMGSMYRIGFEVIYLLEVSSVVVLTVGVWTARSISISLGDLGWEVRLTAVFVLASWLFTLFRDRGARQKRKKATDIRAKHFSWRDLLVLLLVAGGAGATMLKSVVLPGWLFGVPIIAILLLWMVRYFRGYASADSKDRSPIAAAHAALLLAVTDLMALGATALLPRSGSGVSDKELRIWLIGMAAAMVLVCARGHEKRLRGAYATQNTWLVLNRDQVLNDYFQSTTPEVQQPLSLGRRRTRLIGRLLGRSGSSNS